MTGHVVKQGPPPIHSCNPGAEWRPIGPGVDPVSGMDHESEDYRELFGTHYWHDLRLPVGTVWECGCGKTWVNEWIPDSFGRTIVCAHSEWRPETRRERRRRERAQR